MFKRIAAVQVLAGGAFLASFTYIAVLGDQIGMSRAQIAMMAGLYSIAQFLSSYVFGRIADRYGKRKVLLAGLFSLSVLVLLQSLGRGVFDLMLFRFAAGVGFGIYPAALAAFAFEANAKMGKFSSFNALGWGTALLISGPVADNLGIRYVFYMASLMVLGASVIALTLDRIPEARIRSPLLPFRLIKKNREVLLPFIARHSTASAIWVLWPIFLREVIGLSYFQIGLVLATNAFTQFLAMYLFSDMMSPRRSVGTGLILTSIAVLSFTVIRTFPLFLITQVFLGLSWAFLFVGSLRSMMIKNKERATAAGVLNSTMSLSALMGPFIALSLVELLPDIPYRSPMILAGLISFLAFVYFVLFGMKRVPIR